MIKEIRIFSDQNDAGLKSEEIFDVQAEPVCHLFVKHLEKVTIEKLRIINIHCVEKKHLEKIQSMDGFCDVFIEVNVSEVLALSKVDRQAVFLQLIMAGIHKLQKNFHFSLIPFQDAAKEVVSQEYALTFEWRKKKWSPDNKRQAIVEVYWDIETIRMTLLVRDRKKNIIYSAPIEITFSGESTLNMLGDIKWVDNNTIQITHQFDKKKNQTFYV
ncbi:hypothetical protein HCB37_14505 [Listeria booriae]|uniref:hypothetical protein n=1 Tax=Listeria booriae TaxID=1552123 RepID=UPI00162471BD|nr:hypothetical protein [Listeria booriae]MBC1553111.1 hypothetical protein [Listeria booriae]MBC1558463.1 hypothetical protein [Listeria booriae]MBC1920359.1 hypothetical protein [Listeria booriae]MBC2048881.1 hypothetical protein [Listeria booriae]MBC2207814.1 hypothetical protein [Listeria booriae]